MPKITYSVNGIVIMIIMDNVIPWFMCTSAANGTVTAEHNMKIVTLLQKCHPSSMKDSKSFLTQPVAVVFNSSHHFVLNHAILGRYLIVSISELNTAAHDKNTIINATTIIILHTPVCCQSYL